MVHKEHALFDAILARRSVRRYETKPLDAATLTRVDDIVAQAKPLVPENAFTAMRRDVLAGEDLTAMIGAYGRILTPPHFLVPFMVGEAHPLTDLGYRVEQIAVRLAALGIGTCFVGALASEPVVRQRYGLPDVARIAAFLIVGRPTRALFGRAVNVAIRRATGATNKLPPERIFYAGTFARPAAPPTEVAPLIEAARHAPSAVDAQPWRFLWREGRLYLFVKRENVRYGTKQEYRLHDAGICMANVSLALTALGKAGNWRMLSEDQPEVADCPADLQPLAALSLAE